MPPVLKGTVLEYVDLDIDLSIDAAGRLSVLDEEEFESNSLVYGYDESLRSRVAEAVNELRGLIDIGGFPFDHPKLSQQKHLRVVLDSSEFE